MAPSLTIPFEAGNPQNGRTLQRDVQQIVAQKGAFRHVTEKTLLLSSARTNDSSDDDQSDHSAESDLETIQATRERLFMTSNEISRLLQTSLNEINTLQDLVSWALSGRSKVAQTTMSPALKGGVPVGSAEIRAVSAPNLSRNARQRLDDTSNIVRLQAFEKCSEKLQAASKRLETEAQHQSKYWDQMADLRSKGWPISRLPRDGRSLVAHVASTEAGPRYRNKGLIPLRRGENGDLTLPEIQGPSKQRFLAVSVRRKNKITGYFRDPKGFSKSQSPLENALMQAKQMIFEEEVFTEASKEAQLIANMGAKVRSTSIELEITPESSMNITYLPQSSQIRADSHSDDDVAAFVGTGLKIMLVAEHENKYRLRSQGPPSAMALNPRPSPEYVLIRPLLAQIRHHVEIFPVLEILRAYRMSLDLAGLPFLVEVDRKLGGSYAPATLQTLRQVTQSSLKIELPSRRALELNIETQLAPPRFGTQYNSIGYDSECGSRSLAQTSSREAALVFLTDVIARDVTCAILNMRYDNANWKVQSLFPPELVLVQGQEPRAILATSCHSGSLAVSILRMVNGMTEKVIYKKTRSTLIGGNGLHQESQKSLRDTIDSWVAMSIMATE